MTQTEPLADLYRRVVEAVPEAETSWGTFMLGDAMSGFEKCALLGHWQRLCDERDIEVRRLRYGWNAGIPERGGFIHFNMIDKPQSTRLHALGEALIAHAERKANARY